MVVFLTKTQQYPHPTYSLTFHEYIFFSFVMISGHCFEAVSLLYKVTTEISPGRSYTSYRHESLCSSIFTVLFSSQSASI